MDGTLGERVGRLGYTSARRLILAAGLAVLLLTAAVMYVRRVETPEVIGTLLFIPVFIAFVFWELRGGVIAALLATVAYVALRYPAIEAVGAERFGGLILSRGLAYLAFGLIGGWANRQLAGSLNKLELYDQIDDTTGLYNARFFVEDTDLELSRSERYRTVFSVVVVDLPGSAFDALDRRRRSRLLREIGRLLRESVRRVDRAVYGWDGRRHRVAVILPETGAEGARVFAPRLADKLQKLIAQRGVALERAQVVESSVTFPDDQGGLENVRSEFAAIARRDHPEALQERPPE